MYKATSKIDVMSEADSFCRKKKIGVSTCVWGGAVLNKAIPLNRHLVNDMTKIYLVN